MATTGLLEQLQERTTWCKENIIDLTITVINSSSDISEAIVNLNRQQLYQLGEDIKGLRFAPYNSIYYAEMKFNLRGDGKDLTDLFLTGDFQNGMYLYFEGEMYGINSQDWKTSKLEEKYGEIFGLSEDSKLLVFPMLKPPLQELVMNILKTGSVI